MVAHLTNPAGPFEIQIQITNLSRETQVLRLQVFASDRQVLREVEQAVEKNRISFFDSISLLGEGASHAEIVGDTTLKVQVAY